MKPQERLFEILAEHGFSEADGETTRVTSGTWKAGFRTLEIGTGAPWGKLYLLGKQIKKELNCFAVVERVSNHAHPDYGKYYLEVSSFWWEE